MNIPIAFWIVRVLLIWAVPTVPAKSNTGGRQTRPYKYGGIVSKIGKMKDHGYLPTYLLRGFVVWFVLMLSNVAQAQDLLTLYQHAKRFDAEYQAALAQYRVDSEVTPQARAALWPQISGQISQIYKNTNSEFERDDLQGASQNTRYYLSLRQSVFNYHDWSQLRKAQKQQLLAQQTLRKAEEDLMMRLLEAYLNLFVVKHKVLLAKSIAESSRARASQAYKAWSLKLGDKISWAITKAESDSDYVRFLTMKDEVFHAKVALEHIVGIDITAWPTLSHRSDINRLIQSDFNTLKHKLAVYNTDVQLAKMSVLIAQEHKNLVQSGYFPSIELQANRTLTDADNVYDERQESYAALQVDVPLFDGFKTLSSVRQSHHQIYVAKKQLQSTQQQATLTLQQSVYQLRSMVKQVKALRSALRAQAQLIELTQQGYTKQLNAFTDVVEARQKWSQQRFDLIETIRNMWWAYFQANHMLGRLHEKDLLLP